MKRALIFGASGFIGSELTKHLQLLGFNVVALGRGASSGLDFNRPETWSDLIQKNDYVIQLVAPDVGDEESHLMATEKLLHIAQAKEVAHLLFFSSGGAIYGPGNNVWKESDALNPISAYGKLKKKCEEMIQESCQRSGLSYCIVRPSNVYGENQKPGRRFGVVTNFYHKINRNEEINVIGDLEICKDYLHIDDLKQAIAFIINQKKEGTFNLGSGLNYTLKEIIQEIEKCTGKKAQIKFSPVSPFDIPFFRLDCSLAKRELDWSPKINLETGLLRYKGKI